MDEQMVVLCYHEDEDPEGDFRFDKGTAEIQVLNIRDSRARNVPSDFQGVGHEGRSASWAFFEGVGVGSWYGPILARPVS
jgi:hypothetical protein